MHPRAVRVDLLIVRPARLLLLGLTLAACSGGGGPTDIEFTVARLEIATNSCAQGVLEGETCAITVRAFAPDGTRIGRPVLRWFSSNPGIAEVERSGGAIQAKAPGRATITITNSTATVTIDATVLVVGSANKALAPAPGGSR